MVPLQTQAWLVTSWYLADWRFCPAQCCCQRFTTCIVTAICIRRRAYLHWPARGTNQRPTLQLVQRHVSQYVAQGDFDQGQWDSFCRAPGLHDVWMFSQRVEFPAWPGPGRAA